MGEADMAAGVASTQARSPKLLVERARKSFRQASGAEISAIADLSFSVKSGEYVAIVGPQASPFCSIVCWG
jgi:ABC-type glutathione transport system ATPase component